MANKLNLTDNWLGKIKASLQDIEFGSVLIVVHEGKIVQIERTEKKRFDKCIDEQES